MHVARGCGHPMKEVMEMMEMFQWLAKVWSQMKWLKIPNGSNMSALSHNMNSQQMRKVLHPWMLK